jgi:cyclopropane fatty-acyl-phospholipid synthase-like methyltransferase
MKRLWILCVLATSCAREPSTSVQTDPPDEVWVAGTRIPMRKGDVIFWSTPDTRVRGMLELAKVGRDDTVYDLGCGDGRILIAAARDYGARGVGIEIDPELVRVARENARKAGVSDKVEIRQGNMFEVDLSGATVVALYLLEHLNLRLRPRLQRELRPGARVVSHVFGMGDWKPDRQEMVDGRPVYVWTIGAPHTR